MGRLKDQSGYLTVPLNHPIQPSGGYMKEGKVVPGRG